MPLLIKNMNSTTIFSSRYLLSAAAIVLVLTCGCAFDLVSVKQQPAAFVPQTGRASSFVLAERVTARLGTGFATVLKADTAWNQIGTTEFGNVFTTKDQIVKVEASNIQEAQIVVTNNGLAGFYLPVEKTFAPLSKPISLKTK